MSDDALFGDDGLRVDAALAAAVDERTAGQRLRDRQAARIAVGLHPLSYGGAVIRLHPDAPHDARPDDGGTYPRCGGCVHRRMVGGHARDFPKCLVDYTARDLTPAEREANRGTWRESATRHVDYGPRVTGSDASDVRAWWPACDRWAPVAEVREWVSPA